MVKQVIWSTKAIDERKGILNYWKLRNNSNTYSKKLNLLFKEAIKTIKSFPQIGKPADSENVRIKLVRDYLIIYEERETTINILSIWDGRQNPNKLKDIF